MINKLLLQLGIDPSSITFELVFNRLLDLLWANINIANAFALFGAIFYVITLLMRTIVPLRVFGIVGDFFFMTYGALAHSITTFFPLTFSSCPSTASGSTRC